MFSEFYIKPSWFLSSPETTLNNLEQTITLYVFLLVDSITNVVYDIIV